MDNSSDYGLEENRFLILMKSNFISLKYGLCFSVYGCVWRREFWSYHAMLKTYSWLCLGITPYSPQGTICHIIDQTRPWLLLSTLTAVVSFWPFLHFFDRVLCFLLVELYIFWILTICWCIICKYFLPIRVSVLDSVFSQF